MKEPNDCVAALEWRHSVGKLKPEKKWHQKYRSWLAVHLEFALVPGGNWWTGRGEIPMKTNADGAPLRTMPNLVLSHDARTIFHP